jgi:cyclase
MVVPDRGQGLGGALAASIVHYGEYTLPGIKEHLAGRGVKVRTVW